MKRQTRRVRRRKQSRRKRQVFSRRRYRGGANLPVPEGSVIAVNLDPKDPYSVPVLVGKATYENEVLEN